jgi:CDP-diacylglycerol--serine O-phosphatidyltransferase
MVFVTNSDLKWLFILYVLESFIFLMVFFALLKVSGPLGLELDSLADMVSESGTDM